MASKDATDSTEVLKRIFQVRSQSR